MAHEVPNPDTLLEGLSQDIIEWDESNNIDLRTLYPSPRPDGSRGLATADSASTQNSSLFLGKHQQRSNDAANNDGSTKINLDETFRDASRPKDREQRRKERMAGAEREIDSIFGILRMDDDDRSSGAADADSDHSPTGGGGRTLKRHNSSPSETATQQHSNKRQRAVAVGGLQRRRSHPPTRTSSRLNYKANEQRERLRRRMEQKRRRHRPGHRSQHPHPPLYPHSNATVAASDNTCLETSDSERCNNSDQQLQTSFVERSNQDVFSELLSALKTPKDAFKRSTTRAALTTIDKNTVDIKPGPENSGAKNTSYRETAATATAKQCHSQSSRVSISPHPGATTSSTTVATTELNVETARICRLQHRSTRDPPSPTPTTTIPCKERVIKKDSDDDDDDEFGAVSFSGDDFAMIDSLAGICVPKTAAVNAPPATEACPLDKGEVKSDRDETTPAKNTKDVKDNEESDDDLLCQLDFSRIDALVAENAIQQSTGNIESGRVQKADANEDEEYDELPDDLDFDQIDALVASQSEIAAVKSQQDCPTVVGTNHPNISRSPTKGTTTQSDDFDNFLCDVDFADIDALVAKRHGGGSSRKGISVEYGAIKNMRSESPSGGGLSFTRYTRYKVVRIGDVDTMSCTKRVYVASWNLSMSRTVDDEKLVHKFSSRAFPEPTGDGGTTEDGFLALGGEWYHTPIQVGDIVNLCSLFGQFRTDKSALPISLHTYPPKASDIDDLVLVLHPDLMMTPSTISEACSCARRAVLKTKLGSTGLTSKAALVGTIVHSLFEECLSWKRFDMTFAEQVVARQLQEKAEALIGCDCAEADVERDVLNVFPTIRQFALQYTTLIHDSDGQFVGGIASHPDIHFLGKGVHSVEESIVSTELGLKGDIDSVLEVESKVVGDRKTVPENHLEYYPETSRNLMCLELKTGHNQTAHRTHLAQLSLYTFMLQSRYGTINREVRNQSLKNMSFRDNGAASSGILLYLNEKSKEIYHVSPEMNEMKTLISQRNVVASGLQRASIPRGISLSYEDGTRENGDKSLKINLLPAPPANLPDLTDNDHSCKRCYSNRECMLYAASGSNADDRSHQVLMSQFTGHLTPQDLEYFRHWDRLIDIEADAANVSVTSAWLVDARSREEDGNAMSRLTFDREASIVDNRQNTSILCFHRQNEGGLSSLKCLGFSSGSNVIVSTDTTLENGTTESSQVISSRRRMHLVKGFVDSVDDDRIFLSCKSYDFMRMSEVVKSHERTTDSMMFFRVDKNSNSCGTGTLRWNLINFLTGDAAVSNGRKPTQADIFKRDRLPWLRDVVIRLKEPEFENGGAVQLFEQLFDGIDCKFPGCRVDQLREDFQNLNEAQQRAVWKAMKATDYTLIQGLPGTGKSSTISFLARLLVARGKRVLITAYTHSAVDNMMLKLLERGMGDINTKSGKPMLVRVGKAGSCHKGVRKFLYTEVAGDDQNGGRLSVDSLRDAVSNARIVGVSSLSLPRSPVLQNEHFHVVIVDEAGQMNQPVTLGALMAADSFILVGDHKQLPPLVNSEIAEAGGYGVSMLDRLAKSNPSAIAPLTLQYRMNEEICRVSSEAFYGGLMKCGNDTVKFRRLRLPGFPEMLRSCASMNCSPWLETTIHPNNAVIFLNTDAVINHTSRAADIHDSFAASGESFHPLESRLGGKVGGSTINRTESDVVLSVVEALIACGSNGTSLGVVSPFRAQIRVMEENEQMSSLKKEGLELSTVDKYQGRDKDVIILSMVRSNLRGNTGRLLQDVRRLNVAFTRAKCKLIIVGSFKTLCSGSSPLKPILNKMKRRNEIVHLPAEPCTSNTTSIGTSR